MKLLSISFILLFIHTNSFLYAAAQRRVLDSDGDAVKPGIEYYMTSYTGVGSIGIPSGSRKTCPASIIEVLDGAHTVTFQPVDTTNSVIRENSTLLYISFTGAVTSCRDGAGAWSITYDQPTNKYFLSAGPIVRNNPAGQFKLMQYPNSKAYVLVNCPFVPGITCYLFGPYRRGLLNHIVTADPDVEPLYLFSLAKKNKKKPGLIELPK